MAALAGGMVFAAAVLASYIGYRGVSRQIAAEHARVREDRLLTYKQNVYSAVSSGLFSGTLILSKFVNPDLDTKTLLIEFQNQAPGLMPLHMVADPATAEAILVSYAGLSSALQKIYASRLVVDRLSSAEKLGALSALMDECFDLLRAQLPLMANAVTAMRNEINLPVDRDLYIEMVKRVTDNVIVDGRRAVSDLFKGLYQRSLIRTPVPKRVIRWR